MGGIFELVWVGVPLQKFLHSVQYNIGTIGVGFDDGLQVERGEGDVPHCVVRLEGVSYIGVALDEKNLL